MKKIIYILPTFGIRGTEIIYEQVNRLAEKGYDLIITSLDEAKPVTNFPLKVNSSKLEDTRKEFDKADAIIAYNPVCAFYINDIETKANKYCLLLDDEHEYYTKEYFSKIGKAEGVKLDIQYEKQKRFIDASYKLPFKYIVPNEKLAKKLIAKGMKVILAPIGVNLDLFYPEQFIPDLGVIRFVTEVNEFPWQNSELINRALTELRAFELWTFGNKPNIKTDKHWTNPDNEGLRKLLSSSNVLINMNQTDGTSETLLQAMACGCVVVTTMTDGASMFCKDGKNCIIIKGKTPEELSGNLKTRLEELMNNKDLLELLITGGLETAKNFKWNIDNLEKALRRK